jgi:hypothetical protein
MTGLELGASRTSMLAKFVAHNGKYSSDGVGSLLSFHISRKNIPDNDCG